MRLAILTAFCLGGCASTTRIDALVARLDSDAIEEREEASDELRRAGPTALSRLREVRPASAEARARRDDLIACIELDERLWPEPRRARVHYRGTLAGAAATIASRFDEVVVVEKGAENLSVELALDDASLTEALSALRTWSRSCPGRVSIRAAPPRPLHAAGHFLMRTYVRGTEFTLRPYVDPQVPALPLVGIEITRALDASGRPLELASAPRFFAVEAAGGAVNMFPHSAHLFADYRWPAGVPRIAILQGIATFRFHAASTSVTFHCDVDAGYTIGSLILRATDWNRAGCELQVDVADPGLFGDALAELRAVRSFGTLRAGDLATHALIGSGKSRCVYESDRPLRLRVDATGRGEADWTSLEVRVVDHVIEKRIPFEIRNIAR
jgi:hypothetical protein